MVEPKNDRELADGLWQEIDSIESSRKGKYYGTPKVDRSE